MIEKPLFITYYDFMLSSFTVICLKVRTVVCENLYFLATLPVIPETDVEYRLKVDELLSRTVVFSKKKRI